MVAQIIEGQGGPLIDPELLFSRSFVVVFSFQKRRFILLAFGDFLVVLVFVWGVWVDHLLTLKRGTCGPHLDPTTWRERERERETEKCLQLTSKGGTM